MQVRLLQRRVGRIILGAARRQVLRDRILESNTYSYQVREVGRMFYLGRVPRRRERLSTSEGVGFKPTDRENPVNSFQGCRIQPLCHPSGHGEV